MTKSVGSKKKACYHPSWWHLLRADLGPLHPLIITAFTNGANAFRWDFLLAAHLDLCASKVVMIKDEGKSVVGKKWINGNQSCPSLSFRPNQLLSLSPPWTLVLSILAAAQWPLSGKSLQDQSNKTSTAIQPNGEQLTGEPGLDVRSCCLLPSSC